MSQPSLRIESRMGHDLNVPLNPALGKHSPMLLIKGQSADGKPGITDTDKLDTVTLARLNYHYRRRPVDGDEKNKSETDEAGRSRHIEIGLLTFTRLDGGSLPRGTETAEVLPQQSSSSIEPPRRVASAKVETPKPRKRRVA